MSTTEQSIYNEVFISYSRKNVDFARKLVDAIYANGRENVWIDWEDIEYAEDWWQKIQQGIESAENFLFILTPDSVRSNVCYDEVEYAVQAGKRIIPLAYIEIEDPDDFDKMHPAISQHNWLPFSEEDDFQAGMQELFRTLDTDLTHVRFHTRLQTRAREWDNANRNNAYLLSTGELDEANEWLASFAREEKVPLATDLQRDYIEASDIAVKEQRERERKLEERARRTRLYLGAAIPSIIGFIVALIFAGQMYQRNLAADAALKDAQNEVAEADSINDATFASFWGRDGDNPLIGLSYAINAIRVENPPLESQRRLTSVAWQPGAQRQFAGHRGELWNVAFSADGESVFSAAGSFTGLEDNRVIQWHLATGEQLNIFDGHSNRVYGIATSPDGQYLATASQDTSVIIWEIATGDILYELGGNADEHSVPIFGIRFTHDSTRLISAAQDRVIVWDIATGSIVRRVNSLHTDHILSLDITEDDQFVVTGSLDGSITYWNLETRVQLQTMYAGAITGVRFLPDEEQIVTSDQDGNIIIWNLSDGTVERTITYELAALRGGIAVTPDGEYVISADAIGNVLVWELDNISDTPVTTFAGHDGRINGIAIHPENGFNVATASFDGTVIVWDIFGRDAEIERYNPQTNGESTPVYVARLSNTGNWIASGLGNGQLTLRDIEGDAILWQVQVSNAIIYDAAFNVDDTILATAHGDETVRLWDTTTGEMISAYDTLTAPVRTVAFSPDGSLLAAAGGHVQISANRSPDNRIIIWDDAGNITQTLSGHTAAVRALEFLPDGQSLLSSSDDTTIIRWDVDSETPRQTYVAHNDAVWSLAIHPDGTRFLSGSRDHRILEWDINTSDFSEIGEHDTGVRALAYHPIEAIAVSGAGTLDLATSITDFDLQYWDLNEADVLRTMPGHQGVIRSLMFNQDGTEILSASDDGTIIRWYADSLEVLVERIETKYQIICLPEQAEEDCTDEQIDDLLEQEEIAVTGFPSQADALTFYAEDSLCTLPPSDQAPPNDSVDTSMFGGEPPYVIGYSHGSVDGTTDDWVLAWAEYQADQYPDLISGFVNRRSFGGAPQQVRDLQLLIDAGADAIIINPIEEIEDQMAPLQEEIERLIIEEGIPVILVGNRTFDPVYTTYVGYDSYEIGCIMGQELTAMLDGEGSIGVINGVDLSVADVAFKEGEKAVIDQYQGLLLTLEGPTSYSTATARTLTERQEITGLIGYASGITLAAQDGLLTQGLDYVPFASGHSIELARFAVDNAVDASFVRRSAQIGAVAIDIALDILQSDEISRYIRQVPQLIRVDELDLAELAEAPDNAYLGDWQTLPLEYRPRQ